jgi:hypothetical protein
MFEGLSPKVEGLLNAAKSDLPTATADAGLLDAMVVAMTADASAPIPASRRRSMLGKVLTAKAAALAGVLVLTGGVASAATGTLPDPAQNAASSAAEHVGLHIPKSDDHESDDNESADDSENTPTTVEHPDNHGKDVSTVAHDDSNEGADHGSAVCTVASDGKCQPDKSGDDNSGQGGNSGDHRQDGEHKVTTTTTEVNDDSGDTSGDSSNTSDSSGPSVDGGHGGSSNSGGHHDSSDD